jgi:hypothetical protein
MITNQRLVVEGSMQNPILFLRHSQKSGVYIRTFLGSQLHPIGFLPECLAPRAMSMHFDPSYALVVRKGRECLRGRGGIEINNHVSLNLWLIRNRFAVRIYTDYRKVCFEGTPTQEEDEKDGSDLSKSHMDHSPVATTFPIFLPPLDPELSRQILLPA